MTIAFHKAARALLIGAFAALLATPSNAAHPCAPEKGTTEKIARVIDGETLVLDDGREVRLMGALAPRPNALATPIDTWPPATEAKRALEAIVAGRTATLHYEGRQRDRYGRLLAQLFLRQPGGGEAVWVQGAMIAEGFARAYALPGNDGCLSPHMAAEDEARRARRGLWAGETFRIYESRETAALLRLVGRFVLVEGRVAKVARTRRFTYVNFGDNWRDDFTASLETRTVERSDDGAARAAALEGKAVRVRGWIERRNGPMIVVNSLAEIEILEP